MRSVDARIDNVDPSNNGTLEASLKAICSCDAPPGSLMDSNVSPDRR